MPFFIDFTKVNQFFDIYKKNEENFNYRILVYQFNLLNLKFANPNSAAVYHKSKLKDINHDKVFLLKLNITDWVSISNIRLQKRDGQVYAVITFATVTISVLHFYKFI